MTAEQKVNDKHVMRLYRAVANYVEKNGGKVIVAGGIQVQQWDSDPRSFIIAVKCSGTQPKFEKPKPVKGLGSAERKMYGCNG